MFDKIRRGWELTKVSFSVLKQNKSLLLFPLLSGFFVILIVASFLVPLFLVDLFESSLLFYSILFLLYLISYGVIIFFNGALIACVDRYFKGEEINLSYGISFAFSRIGKIFSWALLSATIGMILHFIADKSENIGEIISRGLGAVWSILVFFVVPLLMFENIGVFSAIKRSTLLFKESWGERLTADFSLGFVFTFLSLLGGGVVIAGFFLNTSLGIILLSLAIVYWIALAVINAATRAIFMTALYQFVVTKKPPLGFTSEQLQGAFRNK